MDKARIIGSAPILLVNNVIDSANWYRDKLGFNYDKLWGEPPEFCILDRDDYYIMLSQVKGKADIKPHWKIVDKMWNIYFWVDDVETIYEEFKRNGATIDYSLYLTPYGVKEFGINDIDGYDIAFGEVVKKDKPTSQETSSSFQ